MTEYNWPLQDELRVGAIEYEVPVMTLARPVVDERETSILARRLDGLTLREIAELVGLSEVRVGQILKEIIHKIRRRRP